MPAKHPSTAAVPVTVIIPAYNEENGIVGGVAEVREKFIATSGRRADDVEIIIIDDGSTDKTAERAATTGADVFTHQGNLGYGAAIKTALRMARHEIIVMTDADGTYPAEYMEPLVRELEHCDMAVGSRSGDRVAIPLSRRPAKWALRKLAVFLAEKPIPDLNSGLRAFRKADAMRFLGLYPSGFSFTTTITLAYLCSDLLVHYFPINYNPRKGQSKIRPIRDTKNFVLTIMRSVLFFNPLRVCFPIAMALFAVALGLLFYRDANGRLLDGTIAVLTLSGVQILIIAFLADVIARTR